MTDLANTSVTHISEKVFAVLEERFTNPITSLIISSLLAAREGLLETEIVTLIRNSNLVKGESWKLVYEMDNSLLKTLFQIFRIHNQVLDAFLLEHGTITFA